MRIAGTLAIVLAVILAVWSIMDYVQNDQRRKLAVESATRAATLSEARFDAAQDEVRSLDSAEQFDGLIGIAAAVALIGGIVLLSQGFKQIEPVS